MGLAWLPIETISIRPSMPGAISSSCAAAFGSPTAARITSQ